MALWQSYKYLCSKRGKGETICRNQGLWYICNHLQRQHSYSKINDDKKHTPEGNILSEASINSINASLPWKRWTVHDSRESQLRQVILIFIDNKITGVLLIISALQVSHQLSLMISYDKHIALVTLQIQPRLTIRADWQATLCIVRAQLQKVYLFSKQEITQPLHDAVWYLCLCSQRRQKFWQCSPKETVPSGWRWDGREARKLLERPWKV